MFNLREKIKKFNIHGSIRFDEPMSLHTTFRTGGPADIFVLPSDSEDLKRVIGFSRAESVPVTILGTGANVLVADRGIRGITVHLSGLNSASVRENRLKAGAGLRVHDAAVFAADHGLAGFEFFYAMPGTIGGAVYMNARCYGASAADRLTSVEVLDEAREIRTRQTSPAEFDYKMSPFQKNGEIILSAEFLLEPGNRGNIRKLMESYEKDRSAKGHFDLPSAGSVFKNDRNFGKPSGQIIDSLGLKGYRIGDAWISPKHANIIVNAGNAASADVRLLIDTVKEKVFKALGYNLSEEVIYIGEWDEYDN